MRKHGHPCEVAAWPSEALNEPELDRVVAGVRDDRNGRGRRLCGERSRAAAGDDHIDMTINKIGRQLRQAIIMPLRKKVFDGHVLAIYEAALAKAARERSLDMAVSLLRSATKKANNRW